MKWMEYKIFYATKGEHVTLGDDLRQIGDGIYAATYGVQLFVRGENLKAENRKSKRR